MVFLGLPFGDDSNESFIKKEREADERRRRIMLAEQEAQKQDKDKIQGQNTQPQKKPTRKERIKQHLYHSKEQFHDKFHKAEERGKKVIEKSERVAQRVEKESAKVNLSANRFAEAADTFAVAPNLDFGMSETSKQHARKNGLFNDGLSMFDSRPSSQGRKDGLDMMSVSSRHQNKKTRSSGVDLSLFDVSAPAFPVQKPKMPNRTPRGLSDPLIDAFTVRSTGGNARKGKSDPFFDLMAVEGSQPSKRKKRSSKKQWSWF